LRNSKHQVDTVPASTRATEPSCFVAKSPEWGLSVAIRRDMTDKFNINRLLPQIAAYRRDAIAMRRLARQTSDVVETTRLSKHAEALDREADAMEVRLAILKAADAASRSGQEIAALKSPPSFGD
jgi:hypothetical protein